MRTFSIIATALLASIPAAIAADPTPTAATTTYKKGVQEPSALPTLNAPVVQGCFSSVGKMVKQPIIEWNSKDSCANTKCKGDGHKVAATMAGMYCFCGDKYPAPASRADDSQCNIGCTGYDKQACGGFNSTTNTYYYTVYNTGLDLAVFSESNDDLPQSSSSTAESSPTTKAAGTTVYVPEKTSAPAASKVPQTSDTPSGGKSNTVGIAVGVVVGIIALTAIIGGVFFYMRRKRAREMDEKTHRDAVINNFFGGNKPGSSAGYSESDSRLDPVMVGRRDSIGSIADNQDYSRKILRVTNA